jgi:magnesium transporter
MGATILKHKGFEWVAFDQADEETMQKLKRDFKFHALDLEDVRGKSEYPKLDVYKHYYFLITHFPTLEDSKRIKSNELDIFVEKDTVITITKKPSPYLQNLMMRLQKNAKLRDGWIGQGPSFFSYRILKELYYDSFKPVRLNVAAGLEELDKKMHDRDARKVLLDLSKVRRDVLDMKRILDPQRFVVRELSTLKVLFLAKDMALYFDDLRDLLDRLWSFVESYDGIVKSLADTHESLMSLRTNNVLKVLAIISVAFLPMTLITGIYGMNLSSLPFVNHPTTVWVIFAIIGVFLAIVFGVLKKKRWL